MTKSMIAFIALLAFAGCSSPNRMVYSSGFSFANYDYAFIAKPDAANTATVLYGTDVEFANLLSRYNIKIVGDKEYATLSREAQARTLFARISISASGNRIMLSVSFDDSVSGKTGANFTTFGKGKIFDGEAREEVFEEVAEMITEAIGHDKGLVVRTDD